MILQLSHRYSKKIAGFFLALFYFSFALLPIANAASPHRYVGSVRYAPHNFTKKRLYATGSESTNGLPFVISRSNAKKIPRSPQMQRRRDIGGPGQPEMSSFKSAGTGNLVNLFTGDFSYNIPLLDVGGYPVNIYYDGGIGMEQEASWVGLGWNINPGNINRNMRGIPDDFNGQDTLQQMQLLKPNKTWGVAVGADYELFGVKAAPVGAELGVAFNNYLGPSLDLSLRGAAVVKLAGFAGTEKSSASARFNVGIDINSRSGTSLSANASLSAIAGAEDHGASFGIGLSSGYNSRSGIKALQIAEQVSFNYKVARYSLDKQRFEAAPGSTNETLYSTSISFVKPSYTPALRLPMTNTAWSGRFQLGAGFNGGALSVETEVYGEKSEIVPADTLQKKPMVGYLYYQNAVNANNSVMDFTRFNDNEVTPNTPVISVPQYSYDVFAIQGEGTGGSIRAYRNDFGYVRDNLTTSRDKNTSAGLDLSPFSHYGGNLNTVKTPSTIGEWNSGNKLRGAIPFSGSSATFENVYFRNPGENCVIDSNRFSQVGGTDLVRFVLGGSNNAPTVEPKLQRFNNVLQANTTLVDLAQKSFTARNKRSQVVNFLTAAEASVAGLDTAIKSYDNQVFLDPVTDTLLYENIRRVDGVYRKTHHISQINVTESNGRRYIYGIPVYNLVQKDFTFSVDNTYSQIPDKVNVNSTGYLTGNSALLNSTSSRDGYVQVTTTPAYAHSFLLSGLLSPDYVDVTGNGITEDDLGDAIKFNYTRIKNGTSVHAWRSPLTANDSANFNPGSRSEVKDDKGIISYGERETWYLQSVESKNMIALFYVSNRSDGKGASGPNGGISTTDNFVKKLDSIALFSKSDLRTNGLAKAKPIKTVHFVYAYLLCQNTPDNTSLVAGSKGKLTLQNIYFTYNGKTRALKNQYSFYYNSTGTDNKADNPDYAFGSSDRWGNYKPASMNPGGLKNSDYPYAIQDSTQKNTIDQNASAWTLKKITLPSGGQINVSYESDDYAYVQNKRATEMMRVAGFGSGQSLTGASDRLYPFQYPTNTENDYVFINVPVACTTPGEVYNRYLQGITQLAFKIWVLMPKGPEYITCYANIEPNGYGVETTNHNVIWIKLTRRVGYNPLSITALEYLRQQLPGQAFPGYDVSGEPAFDQVGDMLLAMLHGLRNTFTDPVKAFRHEGKAMHTDVTKCFVRLNDPDGYKYGGGYRVKTVTLNDNWNAMTGQFTASYGQKYDYTTTESFNGAVRKISSGVSSYEPSIGGEENPFQSIIQIEDYLPLGPTSFGAVEMPVLDAFFPSPVVGYSKVTVTSIKTDTSSAKKSRSGIGKQVTEFYTAKDYPVSWSYTPLDNASIKEFHQASTKVFFHKYAYDYKALSQGFLVATNDMHGQMKSQSAYAENDTASRISYTENFYRNTGINGLNDKFSFIGKENSGGVYAGNMGVDVELMTDAREFSVKSTSREVQAQVDLIIWLFPFVPTVWPVTGVAENIYRAVTTTKVVNYHAVLDSVVVIDKGSQLSTKNMAFDAQTGEVLVSRTNNEFNQPVYNTNYPAYWAYGGMGPAYKNIDATYPGVTFVNGKITAGVTDFSVFESGDELLIKSGTVVTGCDPQLASYLPVVVWAFDKNKNNTSLATTPDFIFLDERGYPCNLNNVTFRVIRSGRRNQLGAKAAMISGADNPLASGKLSFTTTSKVINASASEFKEKWLADNDVFKRKKMVLVGCTLTEVDDSTGYLEKNINPYRKGLVGNFRPYRSMVFYDNRKEYDTTATTNISANGYLNNFKPYWNFDVFANLVPDTTSTQWVWNSKLSKANAKGLELETVDALGVYTSAQYGFNKTIPVAIANNARYNEMFAESFEDYGYGESLSRTTFNSSRKHIDFSQMAGSVVVNTDTSAFRAHSGRRVLAINGTATLTIPYNAGSEKFDLVLPAANVQQLVKGPLGGNFDYISSNVKLDNYPSTFSTGNILGGVFYTLLPYIPNTANPAPPISQVAYHYYISTRQYFQITSGGTYVFKFQASNNNYPPGITPTGPFPQYTSIAVLDTVNNITYLGTDLGTTNGTNTSTKTKSFCLDKGVYVLAMQFYVNRSYSCTPTTYSSTCALDGVGNQYLEQDQYTVTDNIQPSTSSIQFFKNYTTVAGCSYTKTMSATDSMINTTVSITPGKKMVFSAWVRENCGDAANGIPCKEYTYTHNQVQLKFTGVTGKDTSLTPAGPIIDGWQRYEGSFTVPTGSTAMTLNLVNSGTGAIYFDDIRIHPFNSNVKSYVYDPVSLRLVAELDANNYGTFYEYDEEGTLVRTKVETREGIKTITETRSALQQVIH